MLKSDLRKLMLQQRKEMPAEKVAMHSRQIADLFFRHFPLSQVGTLHVFLPILQNNEVNTWLIIHRLWQEHPHMRIAVPVTNFGQNTLSHALITPETPLEENHWGITEPVGAAFVAETEIDLLLMPLLAFDVHGNRVGYGKGYYDRFLRHCRPEAQRIGLSLEPPVPAISDVNEFDEPLHACITPGKVYHLR